jgi:hypothetical protein
MAQRAVVSSIEAIEQFRSQLIVYLSRARPTVEEVSVEVQRVRSWLESEQRVHWENQLKRRSRALQEAQAALFSAKMSNLKDDSSLELLAVQRAKRAVEEAEDKLRVVRKWTREFDSLVQPLLKQTEKVHTVLAHDMVNAAAMLSQIIQTLHAYADVSPVPSAGGAGGAPGSGGPAS